MKTLTSSEDVRRIGAARVARVAGIRRLIALLQSATTGCIRYRGRLLTGPTSKLELALWVDAAGIAKLKLDTAAANLGVNTPGGEVSVARSTLSY